MLCGSLSRVEGIPHFTHDILDQLSLFMADLEDDDYL
jgi:hypothetical protein